jgi:transcriptional regulator with XRE-family HTH domain
MPAGKPDERLENLRRVGRVGGKRDLDAGASPMHFFGKEVRLAREAAGLTQAELGATVPCDGSTVSKVEAGDLAPTERFAVACDEAFPHMAGWFLRFYQDARKWGDGPFPAWFQPFVAYESAAKSLRWYEPLLVPGLLQVESYAREVLRGVQADASDEEIEQQVRARLERREILTREDPPHLWAVIDEGVLHRRIGTAKTMLDQLWHLHRMSEQPKVSLQVIPFGAGARSGLLGHFVIAEPHEGTGVVYLETAIAGQVVEAPSVMSQAALSFDTLRSEALPRQASRDLIMKIVDDHEGS